MTLSLKVKWLMLLKIYLNKEEDKMTKSLAMISGGLDSILAAKLIKEQGIDVLGI